MVRTNLLQEGVSQSQLIAPTSCWSLHNSSIIVFVVWLIEGMENSNKWGRDCLKETRINLRDVVEVVGEGAIERQNTVENWMEWGDLDLSICSQLTLSGYFSRHLPACGTSQSYQASFSEADWEIYISGSLLKKERSSEEKCIRVTCIQKFNFLGSNLIHEILHDTYLYHNY